MSEHDSNCANPSPQTADLLAVFPPIRTLDVSEHFIERFRERVNSRATIREVAAAAKELRPISNLIAHHRYRVFGLRSHFLKCGKKRLLCEARSLRLVFVLQTLGDGRYQGVTVIAGAKWDRDMAGCINERKYRETWGPRKKRMQFGQLI